MSTTQRKFPESTPVTVMVRAYEREPVKLRAVALAQGRVEVVGDSPNISIRLPGADVFRFDGELFAKLQAAFRRGDRRQLAALWEEAEPFASDPAHQESET